MHISTFYRTKEEPIASHFMQEFSTLERLPLLDSSPPVSTQGNNFPLTRQPECPPPLQSIVGLGTFVYSQQFAVNSIWKSLALKGGLFEEAHA